MKLLAVALLSVSLFAQTTLTTTNTVVQANAKRPGINLGSIVYYGPGQLYRNLISQNPGFGNTIYSSVIYCSTGTNQNLCSSGSGWYYPTGFWITGTQNTVRVLTGAAAGQTTYVTAVSGSSFSFPSGGLSTLSSGDYIEVTQPFLPSNTQYQTAYGWQQGGSGTYSIAYSSDAPPSPTSNNQALGSYVGSNYTQSVQMSSSGPSDYAYLIGAADALLIPWLSTAPSNYVFQNFIDLNGTYTVTYWAKALSGASPQMFGRVYRGSPASPFIVFTDNLTTTWTQYTHTFTASETGVQTPGLNLSFATVGSESIELANAGLFENQASGNPTQFRNAVVTSLQALKPGILRMWDGQSLTSSLQNMLVDQFARVPVNYKTTGEQAYPGAPWGYYNDISYSIPDFLQLCQTVGAEPWINLPVTLTPAEAGYLIDYLSDGTGLTPGGAYRVGQGFATPWTTVFAGKKIHLELGNEEWNGGTFEGGSMEYNYATYGAYANSIFGTMKAKSTYQSGVMQLVLSTFFQNAGSFLQTPLDQCPNCDQVDVGPYMDGTLTDASSTFNEWAPGLAEPQLFWQTGASCGGGGTACTASTICVEYTSGGLCPSGGYYNVGGVGTNVYAGPMYLAQNAANNSVNPRPLAVYEEANGSYQGTLTQSQYWGYNSAWGAGLEQASEFLTNMQNGVIDQNYFQLAQYYFAPNGGCPTLNSSGICVYIWGSTVDMGGPTNRVRPVYLVQQAIDNALATGASMITTNQTSPPANFVVGNVTSYPASGSTINTVATKSTGVQTLQTFTFCTMTAGACTGNYAMMFLNLDTAASHGISTFSGTVVPTGTVTQTLLNSTNLTDTNEASTVVAPVITTLSNPTSITLPPHSFVIWTWGGSATPGISFSPTSLTFGAQSVGVPSATQTITVTNSGGANLTISAIAASGDFSQTNTCGSLPATITPAGTCNIVVTFTPTTTGTRTGNITVTDNAAGSPQAVPLTGTGISSTPTYYVSNTGSDSNNGLTTGTAWQTIAKVNAQTLTAGTTILFQAGGLWREQLTIGQSGTSGSVITIGSYGTGALPVITGGNLASWTNVSGNVWSTSATTNPLYPNFSGTPGILVASQGAVTAANDFYWNGSTTLYVYSTTNPVSIVEIPARATAINANCQSYLTFTGLDLRAAKSYGIEDLCATSISNVLVQNSTIHLNYSDGFYAAATGATASTSAITFTNVQANQNGSSGLKVSSYTGGATVGTVTAKNNVANDNCRWPNNGSDENTFCGGIYVASPGVQSAGPVTLANNTANYNGTNAPASFLNDVNIGTGIWCDTVTTCKMNYNVTIGNTANGQYLEKTVSSIIYRGVSYNNAGGGGAYIGQCAFAAGFGFQSTNNTILQSTCEGTGYAGLVENFETTTSGTDGMSGNQVVDSLIGNTGGAAVAVMSNVVNTTGYYTTNKNTFSYSGFGTVAQAPSSKLFHWTSDYTTYSSFETPWCGSTGCTNSMQSDPKFYSDYTLQPTSPAIQSGTYYTGYPSLCNTNPDLGALPYPCNLTVVAGANITLTSPTAVSWSVSGTGPLGTLSTAGPSTSTTYTAPTGIVAQNQMMGCPVGPNDSVFNTRIDNLPLDPNSSTKINNFNPANLRFEPSWGISYADGSTSTVTLNPRYSFPIVSGFPIPALGPLRKTEAGQYNGTFSYAALGNSNIPDHHLLVARKSDCTFAEAYDYYNFGYTTTTSCSTSSCNAAGAQIYAGTGYAITTGNVDAAGLELAPLTWHLDELKSGAINHATRFTENTAFWGGGWQWPATSTAGGTQTAPCTSAATCAQMGSRLRLKASFNAASICTGGSIKANAYCTTMLTALQQYGMFLADSGTNTGVQVGVDITADPDGRAAELLINNGNIATTNFEVVDESSFEVQSDLYQVNGNQPYQASVNQITINGGGSSVSVALQPIAIGTTLPYNFPVQAGSYTINLATFTWVVPSTASQAITWTVVGTGCGSVSGSSYTPPTTTATGCYLHGVAAADAAANANIYLTILPAGTSPTGSIRIDSGSLTNTTDGNGNVWIADPNPEGITNQLTSDSPNWTTSNPLSIIYQSQDIGNTGSDLIYSIGVPNGQYKIHLLFGELFNGCGCFGTVANFTQFYDPLAWSPYIIETQGNVALHQYNWSYGAAYLYAYPQDIYVPAKVTNNLLQIAVRSVAPDLGPSWYGTNLAPTNGNKVNGLNGVEILPDAGTAPFWSIDTLNVKSLATGSTAQLFVTDWYTGTNNPTWSIASDPTGKASINSSTGVLSIASGTLALTQPVVVKATNGTYTAYASFNVIGSRTPIYARH